MVANPHYWRGAPKLAEVDFTSIPDENTLLTTMQSHEIDAWTNAPAALYRQASTIPATRAILTRSRNIRFWDSIRSDRSCPTSTCGVRSQWPRIGPRLIDTVAFGVQILNEGGPAEVPLGVRQRAQTDPVRPEAAAALLDAAGCTAVRAACARERRAAAHRDRHDFRQRGRQPARSVLQSAWHTSAWMRRSSNTRTRSCSPATAKAEL